MTLKASNWNAMHSFTDGVSDRVCFKTTLSVTFSVFASVGMSASEVTIEDVQLHIVVLTQNIIKSYDT